MRSICYPRNNDISCNGTYSATRLFQLYWRTRNTSVAAIDTAIALLGPKRCSAMFAHIKERAGVCRHLFGLLMTTFRAGKPRFRFYLLSIDRNTCRTRSVQFIPVPVDNGCTKQQKHAGIQQIDPVFADIEMVTAKNQQRTRYRDQ